MITTTLEAGLRETARLRRAGRYEEAREMLAGVRLLNRFGATGLRYLARRERILTLGRTTR